MNPIHVNILRRILSVLEAALFNQNVNSWYQVAGLILAVACRGEVECLEDVSNRAKTLLLPTSVSFVEF